MSPYRVEAVDSFDLPHILSANIAKQLDTSKAIQIVERLLPRDKYNPSAAAKCIAHQKTTTNNSIVVAKYYVEEYTIPFQYTGLPQKGYKLCKAGTIDYVDDTHLTLADCLIAAMNHYCLYNGLEIVNSL